MILLDANLLIYAYHSSLPQHERSHQWLDEQLNGTNRVGLPWPSILAFVRLVSNPRAFTKAVSPTKAWQQAREWLNLPVVWIPQPTEQHAEILDQLIPTASTSQLIPDAHLAALAIEHGLKLCSADNDFARFKTLNWFNPLD